MKIKAIILLVAIISTLFATDVYSAHAEGTAKTEHESLPDKAEDVSQSGYHMQATAYCINGTTASGTQTRVGVAASKREWLGKTAKVYRVDKDGNPTSLIGTYSIEDTGGKSISSGKVIDLWFSTYEEAINFGRKSVYVVIE